MRFDKRLLVVIAVVVLIVSALVGGLVLAEGPIAAFTQDDDNDTPITGAALEDASAAALEYTGEGQVTDTEVGDEEGYYEVEVTLDDGSQIDVHLDENFNVLGQEADGDEADD